MQLIKKKERLGNIAFYIGITIHLLLMAVGFGDWGIPFHGRLMQIAFVFFCVKILMTYYSKKEWLAMIPLGVLGVLSYIGTGDEYVISVVVMVFAAKNAEMGKVCKGIFFTTLAFTIGTAVLSLLGIGGIPVDIRDYGRGGEEARWCLGFGHANNLHGTIWYLVALLIILYFEKMDWRHYLLLTAGNLALYYFTISKGGLIATQLMIIAAFLLRYIKMLANQTWIYLCGVLGIAGVFLISMISVTVEWTKSSILMLLDRLFTGRINLAYQHAHISMWKLISDVGEFGDTVDNGWITMFFNYGYVFGMLFVIFHLYLVYKAWKEKNGVLLAVTLTCVFYTFMEASYTVNASYLLSNLCYITAMIFMAGKKELENESGELKD